MGELVDADEPESEWRYYHQDGNHLVRQTTNMAATVTLAWTYSPEGAIVLGEKGPVTNLGCEGNTTYDFSTGLIFKNGNYFDPNTGIWITLSGVVVWNGWQTNANNRNKKHQRRKRLLLLLLLFLVIITLAGCADGTPTSTPVPNPTETCTPTNTPMPTLPPPLFNTPSPTIGPPNTPTPWPTTTPSPTWTPTPTSSDPLAGFQLANPLGGQYYEVCPFGATYCGIPYGNHDGVDLVSKSYTDASCSGVCSGTPPPPAAGPEYRKVYSPVTGKIESRDNIYDTVTITDIKHNVTQAEITGLEIKLTHINVNLAPIEGTTINAGQELSHYIGADVSDRSQPGTLPAPDYRPHLHLAVIYQGSPKDPLSWLTSGNIGYYYNSHMTLPKSSGAN